MNPTVGTIMTRHVVTVGMDEPLRHVRDLFLAMRFHHLVVVEKGKAVGVVSDRDLLKHVSPFVERVNERVQDAATLQKRVHQIMSRKLVWCGEGAGIGEAGKMMLDHGVSSVVVLDEGGGCVGIVTMRDVMAWSLVACAGGAKSCDVPRAA